MIERRALTRIKDLLERFPAVGDDRFKLKSGIEAISLRLLQALLLESGR